MARTTNGTLELSVDASGLHSTAYLNPKRTDVRDLLVAIDDKTVTEMSFAFMLDDGEFNEDFSQFRITKVDLNRGDVSAVNYGANPYTSIAARSREIMAELEHLPAGAARAALARLQHREDLAQPMPDPAGNTVSVDRLSRQLTEPKGRQVSFVEALLDL
jgi:phage head maturation protease